MQERLTELESRIAFQDDTIQKLNDVVVSQQEQIDKLESDLKILVEQVRTLTPENIASESEETPPPHY